MCIRDSPYMKDLWFLSDPDLVHLAERAAGQGNGEGKIRTGRGVSGDQFIDQAGRSSIIEKFNPDCVDMESAAVAHVCYVNQIPFLALRAISDTPHPVSYTHLRSSGMFMSICGVRWNCSLIMKSKILLWIGFSVIISL